MGGTLRALKLKAIDEKMLSYCHRHSFLTKKRTYQLGNRALIWQDEDGPEMAMPYDDIMSVEGQYSPSRVQSNRYLLSIKSRKKERVDITNTTYKGYGDFQENNDSYVPFIRELHRKIMAQNPDVIFKKGISQVGYYLSILTAALLLIVVIVAGYFFFIHGYITVVIFKVVFIIYYFPSLMRYIQKNKPGIYDPIALPSEIIPES